MNRRFAYLRGLGLAMLIALALRCPHLEQRPMHNDEAVNAIKFGALWEHGAYQYDPNEHHGPTLPYATWAWAKLTGAADFAHIDESRLRLLTVLFGVGLIALLPLIADGLGRNAVICAGVLTAVSPAMVFYSRYYIHEMPLVFFTLLALGAGWRYTRHPRPGWALLAGAAVGLMQATKETFVLTLLAVAAALIQNAVWRRKEAAQIFNQSEPPIPDAESSVAPLKHGPRTTDHGHAALALAAWFLISVTFFSSFFTNAAGPLDAVRAYLPWLHRAEGLSPHIHPWVFYLERLAFFHSGRGPVWSEGFIIALAVVGFVAAFKGRGLASANADFVRFLAFYTITLTAIYCLLPYKTPWCLLGFWHGLILLAGVGLVALFQWLRQPGMRIVVGIILLAGTVQLAVQAWQSATTWSADPGNPYVYAQTSPDLLELVDQVNALAQVHSQGTQMTIKIIAPDSDYWPLPWYLRAFSRIGWWSEPPADPYAPVVIVSTQCHTSLDAGQTHIMAGIYKLRPGAFLELYVQKDLWQAYLAAKPPSDPAK